MDFEEMKNAIARAKSTMPGILDTVNYTAIYNYVYENLNRDNVSHEEIHKTALRITDALWDLQLAINSNGRHLTKSAGAVVMATLRLFK
jgi:hypothetical protein